MGDVDEQEVGQNQQNDNTVYTQTEPHVVHISKFVSS